MLPTSNVKTGTVGAWERHPIGELHRAGVAVTVNSDDPGLFATTLTDEWDCLMTRLGLTAEETLAIGARTARATSFRSRSVRPSWRRCGAPPGRRGGGVSATGASRRAAFVLLALAAAYLSS